MPFAFFANISSFTFETFQSLGVSEIRIIRIKFTMKLLKNIISFHLLGAPELVGF